MANVHELAAAVGAPPEHKNEKKREKRQRKKEKGKKEKRKRRRTLAEKADPHLLYERSVQDPEADIEFIEGVFEERFGRPLRELREDFCGTAAMAVAFVARHAENKAFGVDIDGPTLDSGRERHVSKLDDEQRSRLQLIEADVRSSGVPKVEAIAALNFSYCVFKRREELRHYFETAREGLREDGLLVLDIYGGPDAQTVMRDKHTFKGFTYIWDQKEYDPITSETLCHIHFRMADGSRLKRAFTYDWRLWTIKELCEILEEAGFARTDVYWEGPGDDGTGDGVFLRKTSVENEDAWVAYVVGGG